MDGIRKTNYYGYYYVVRLSGLARYSRSSRRANSGQWQNRTAVRTFRIISSQFYFLSNHSWSLVSDCTFFCCSCCWNACMCTLYVCSLTPTRHLVSFYFECARVMCANVCTHNTVEFDELPAINLDRNPMGEEQCIGVWRVPYKPHHSFYGDTPIYILTSHASYLHIHTARYEQCANPLWADYCRILK